jgi:hypothetical protein
MSILFRETRALANGSATRGDADPEMLGHVVMGVAALWPLYVRTAFEDGAARRTATTRLARELKRLLLYGVLDPAKWPNLVAQISRTPKHRPRRARRHT